MAETNLEFLGKDKERLGKVSGLFSSREDLDAFLKIVEESAGMQGSTQQKREYMLKNMLGNPKFRQYLKVAMPDFFKEGLKAERGEGWKMSMKDIEKATQATEEELLDPKKGWMGSEVPMADLKFLLESEGLDYSDALKILQEGQTRKNIKDMWYDESLPSRFAMSAVAPFQSDKLAGGEVPSDADAYKDIAMAGATVFPWGKAAGLVSSTGARVLPNVAKYPLATRGFRYGAEFAGPGMVEGFLTEGDFSDKLLAGIEASGRNAGVAATIAGGSQFLKSWATKNAKRAMKDIEDALKETVYPAEIEQKLNALKSTLAKDPTSLNEADLSLLRTVEYLKKLRNGNKTNMKLGDIGTYSKNKADKYKSQVEKDPIVKEHRDNIKERLDEYEKVMFEQNPGRLTFTDWMRTATPEAKAGVGFGAKSGLGKPRVGMEKGKTHPLIADEPRQDMNYWLAEEQKAMNKHTDPYYPRATELDVKMEEFLNANPEVKVLIDAGKVSRQDIADFLRKRLYPSMFLHGKSGLTSRKEREAKEKE